MVNGVLRKIYIIGDSTVQTYGSDSYPQMGWGQVLQEFFDPSLMEIHNHAIGGRSSRSFHEEGRWTEVVNNLSPGDYVFIQFGHNDRDWSKPERYTDTAQFKDYLRIYVNETRAAGAYPVLISPMIMNAYGGSTLRNVFTEGANDYRGAMLEVAEELDAYFVDLNMKSYDFINSVGLDYSRKFIFLGLDPGEYPNFPDGISDGTHFQELGAYTMASLIVDGLEELPEDSITDRLDSAYLTRYEVNVTTVPEGGAKGFTSCKYPVGVHVKMKAFPESGYTIHHWEDNSANNIGTDDTISIIVDDHDYNYSLFLTDCSGEVGGSAYRDKCEHCVGGNTGDTSCVSQFKFASSCNYDGVVEDEVSEEVTIQYVNTTSFDHASSMFSIQVLEEKTYPFGIFYSNAQAGEKLDVYVNDTHVHELDLEISEGWSTIYFDLNLINGYNKIKFISQSVTGGVFLESLNYYAKSIYKGSCNKLGSEDFKLSEIKVYPNPFQDDFIIQNIGRYDYGLYNLQGMIIKEGKGSDLNKIGSGLPNGTYLLKVVSQNRVFTEIIEKR